MEAQDKAMNLVLNRSHERIFSMTQGVQVNQLGLYVIRGDNVAMIGKIEEEIEEEIDYENLKGESLGEIFIQR